MSQRQTFENLLKHSENKMIDISGIIEEVIRRSRKGNSRVRITGVGTVKNKDLTPIDIDGHDFVFYMDYNKVMELSEGDRVDLRCKVKRLSIYYDSIELNYVKVKQDSEDSMLEDWKLRGII